MACPAQWFPVPPRSPSPMVSLMAMLCRSKTVPSLATLLPCTERWWEFTSYSLWVWKSTSKKKKKRSSNTHLRNTNEDIVNITFPSFYSPYLLHAWALIMFTCEHKPVSLQKTLIKQIDSYALLLWWFINERRVSETSQVLFKWSSFMFQRWKSSRLGTNSVISFFNPGLL